jgi:hypothetical protein
MAPQQKTVNQFIAPFQRPGIRMLLYLLQLYSFSTMKPLSGSTTLSKLFRFGNFLIPQTKSTGLNEWRSPLVLLGCHRSSPPEDSTI